MCTETPCWAQCPGWTIDWMGFVRPCGTCRRLASDAEAAAALRAFIERFPVPPRAEHQCAPTCRGWDVVERQGSRLPGYDIAACGDCDLFADDDDALGAAALWILDRLAEIAADAPHEGDAADAGGGACSSSTSAGGATAPASTAPRAR